MSTRIENLIGIDNELLNVLNKNHKLSRAQNLSFFNKTINPIFLSLITYIFILVCILCFYFTFTFLSLLYSTFISLLVSIFYTFFVFNIYRLLFCGSFGPAQEYEIIDPNSKIITYSIKYFFLLILGLLFSNITSIILFQKNDIIQYISNHKEINLDILSIFFISKKISSSIFVIENIFFLVLFLLPQLIIEFKVNITEIKTRVREINTTNLNNIENNNLNYLSLEQLKKDWKEENLAVFSNKAWSSKTNYDRNINQKMYDYLTDKEM